jgi:hypothetical protein
VSSRRDLADTITSMIAGVVTARDLGTRDGRDLIDERNRTDLDVYVTLAADHHAGVKCEVGRLCPGATAIELIQTRGGPDPDAYKGTLLLTAINVLAERDATIADLQALVLRLGIELTEAQGRLADADGHTDA